MMYGVTYLGDPFEEEPGAVYVPGVRVETRHAERRLVSALWHIDSALMTRSSLKPFRGIKVDDVAFACLYLFMENDLPLGRYEHLARVHILTTQLRISARTQGAGCSPYGQYSGRARIRYPVHVFCQGPEAGFETYFDDLAKKVQQGNYSPLQMVRIDDIVEAGHYQEGLFSA